VLLWGQDVSRAIRVQSVGEVASRISALPAVRAALLDLQRSFGARGGIVAEGRDLGTVVFPDAEAKFYLTASSEVRARRRHAELSERGESATLDEVRREVIERDERDSRRTAAPLRQAEDAILVDCSSLSVEQVVTRIVARVREIEGSLRNGAPEG
jgi:cytidylate kinase